MKIHLSYIAAGTGCALLAGAIGESTAYPLTYTPNRPSPLHFGLYVTPDPEMNPINPPERFTGFHAGTDYEVSSEERFTDVAVFAICSGTVAYSGFAEGYGGLLVARCHMQAVPVTVLYGHLVLDHLPLEGEEISRGQIIGFLAPPHSYESGHNRKHLHLGIHIGDWLDFRGYVQSQEELEGFIDPQNVLPGANIEAITPDMVPYWKEEQ